MAMDNSPERPQPLRNVVQATKAWVERLGWVWVEGQLIEIKRRAGASTHFLKLRDRIAEISVTVSVGTPVLDAAGPITEGTTVAAWVRPTVWSASGSLTFECREIRPSGEGRLLAQLEQRKRMLQAEGLFDPARKRRLPFLPRTIGLITAAGSAAERDVVENVRRRWAAARIDTRHALMQGPQAAGQVMDALASLERNPDVEVVVIARGGGSLEDLLPFSDEGLVRAVYRCRVPVISAIGHESDTPILDLVADVRASTPTDAAKRVVPDADAEAQALRQALARLRRGIVGYVAAERRQLAALRSRPVLRDPSATVALHIERLQVAKARMNRTIDHRIAAERSGLGHALSRVRALSPQATLERGYAILVNADAATVASVAQVHPGDALTAHLADGTLGLGVTAVPQVQETA